MDAKHKNKKQPVRAAAAAFFGTTIENIESLRQVKSIAIFIADWCGLEPVANAPDMDWNTMHRVLSMRV
ncbi:hypothetical protein ACI2KG_05185 [Pseudomonas sp. NPDC089407]|uniref:hypothetical protein n=1 Tax=Pseudomonas sp. NPDC089407 TaxID=3364464 RepID=UPI00384D01A0